MIKTLIFIGMGSFCGGIARYGVSRAATHIAALPSLWGTLAANLLGCFLIGLLYGLFERHGAFAEHWKMFLTVGFCGGFTTFSTFVHENYSGLTDGRFFEMACYTAGSFLLGLIMVHFGHILTR